jgi:hypothetical protein
MGTGGFVRMAGAKFYAIANTSPSLRDAIV